MKRIFLALLFIILTIFSLSAKSNFYFSVGPEVGIEGFSMKETSSLLRYYGGNAKLGVFVNPMFSFYAGTEINEADFMSSYSTFSTFRSGYSLSAGAGFGFYFNGLDLLFDAGIRGFNIGKDLKAFTTMYNFGITPQFNLVSGHGHAFKAILPFNYAFNKDAKFYSVSFSIIYEYGVRK